MTHLGGVMIKIISLFFLFIFTVNLQASEVALRWTGAQDKKSDLSHILDVVAEKSNLKLNVTNFLKIKNPLDDLWNNKSFIY
jgi:hypothetical protein